MGPGEMQRENKSDRIMKSCDVMWCDGCQCFGRAVCFKPCKAPNFDIDAKTCHFLDLKHLFSAVGVNKVRGLGATMCESETKGW